MAGSAAGRWQRRLGRRCARQVWLLVVVSASLPLVCPQSGAAHPGTFAVAPDAVARASRRLLLLAPAVVPLAASAADGQLHVVRPPEGAPLLSFDLPADLWEETPPDGKESQPGLVAKYETGNGVKLVAGPTPEEDFVKSQKSIVLPSRQKTLKYKLSDTQDDYECLAKILENDMSETVLHRWYRVLKDPATNSSALIAVEMRQERFAQDGPMIEAILRSFHLGS